MSDKPRTWTLAGNDPFELPAVEAGSVLVDEEVRVVELEPVLDLLERFVTPQGSIDDVLIEDTEALLREHGRLEET